MANVIASILGAQPPDADAAGIGFIDGGSTPAERFTTYDALGGTVQSGGGMVPGVGGNIVIVHGTNKYRVTIAPFTGKLTVQKIS